MSIWRGLHLWWTDFTGTNVIYIVYLFYNTAAVAKSVMIMGGHLNKCSRRHLPSHARAAIAPASIDAGRRHGARVRHHETHRLAAFLAFEIYRSGMCGCVTRFAGAPSRATFGSLLGGRASVLASGACTHAVLYG